MHNLLKKSLSKKGGYTIIELIVYMAIIAVIALVIFDVIFFVYRINSKIVSIIQIDGNAYSASERIIYEIENSRYIYLPTSNFSNYNYDSSKSAQLSLITSIGAVSPETMAFMDFYVENGTLFLKKDGTDPVALTSGNVIVSGLSFSYFKNDWRESVLMDLTIRPAGNLNSDSSVHIISSAALRSSND